MKKGQNCATRIPMNNYNLKFIVYLFKNLLTTSLCVILIQQFLAIRHIILIPQTTTNNNTMGLQYLIYVGKKQYWKTSSSAEVKTEMKITYLYDL